MGVTMQPALTRDQPASVTVLATDRPGRSWTTWLRWTAITLVLGFFLFPVLYLVTVSLKPNPEILAGQFLPSRFAWENWSDGLAKSHVLLFLRNSLLVASFSALLTMLVAIPATYAMVRFNTGKGKLHTLVLSSYVAPPVVALLPLFFLLKQVSLIDSLPGLAIVQAMANLPVAIWLLDSFVRALPAEIEEAAWVDGAGYIGTIIRIVVPLIAPGIIASGIICFILSYNEFLFALVLTYRPETQTLPVGLALFQGDRMVQFGQMAAASLTGMAPVYLLAIFFQRWLIGGLTSGAVK